MDVPALAKIMDGKLLLHQELPFDSHLLPHLIKKNLLQTKPALKKSLFDTECTRCGNQDKRYFAEIPCEKCNRKHFYCRKCIEMGRAMECEFLYYWNGPPATWSKQINPCSWQGELTPAQAIAAERITTAILKREPEILIHAVCGAGKTEMLFQGITHALESGLRVCIATPRADVVRELNPRLKSAFQDVPIQALYGGSKDKEKNDQFVIATTHQLLRFQEAFDVMIIDEVDAFPFHADPALPFAQKRAVKQTSTTIYLTATPKKDLQKKIRRGKLPHVFVPVRYHGHPLPVPTLKMCFGLEKELQAYRPPKNFFTWLEKRKNPKRQLLIFVPTVELATKLESPLCKILIEQHVLQSKNEMDAVHAADPNREEKVLAFRDKSLKVIITTTILERGVTFPSVDVAILDAGHDVFDGAALVQIAGRAGRDANDPTGEVMFFHNGKTEAMLSAIYAIQQMNKRGGFN